MNMAVHSQSQPPAPARRLRRAERHDQILAAATRAFGRAGFAATGLDEIAAEAGISRVILYRHFDSKTDLYPGQPDRERTAERILHVLSAITEAAQLAKS